MIRLVLLVTLTAVLWAAPLWAAENFPLPDFTTGYQSPDSYSPSPPPAWHSQLDMALLALALIAAAWIVLRRRSRRELFILMLFSLVYFGFIRNGCICAVGAVQNVVFAVGDNSYALPLVAAVFFALPLLFALFVGRVFCGAVCPLGAIQDVVLLRPLKVPVWLDNALRLLPYVYLGLAVLLAFTGSLFIICAYDPFVSFFRFGGAVEELIAGAVIMLLAVFVGRPYCRWLCPYGVLLRWLSPFAMWQVRLHQPDKECITCHLCADACPFGAISPPLPPDRSSDRRAGRRQLGRNLAILPLILAIGGVLGYYSSPLISRIHPVVHLAERVILEEQGLVEGQTEASEAFELLAHEPEELFATAGEIRRKFDIGSTVLGMWIALVVSFRALQFNLRRRREGYEIDQAACLACARCYASCPIRPPSADTHADNASTMED